MNEKSSMAGIAYAFVMIFAAACSTNDTPKTTEDSQGTDTTTDQTGNKDDEQSNGEEPGNTEEPGDVSEPEIKDGGTLVIPLTADPKVMNPLYAVDSDTITPTQAMFAPLFVLDAAKDETRYYLADSVDISDDYKTYTVKLKDNLKWHDGEAITADDLVYTMDAIMDEANSTHFRGYFMIDGEPVTVNKVDDLTVEFVLPEVSVPFITNLARIRPLPEHYYGDEEDLSTSTLNANPVGSGPFKFKSFDSGQRVELERFDDYFDGKPHLDSIVMTIIADHNSANTAVLNGELDARRISPSETDKFDEKDFEIYVYDGGRVDNMVLKQTNEALQKKEVRQAIAYGINKEEIIQGVFFDDKYATPAYSVFGPNTLYYTDDVERYEYDVEKAKQLLKEAGYDSLDLRLAYTGNSEQLEAVGLIMQQQLAEVGINIELMPLERGAFVTGLTNPESTDFDMAFNGYNVGYEPDGYSPLFLSGEPNNFMKYENADLDKLWAEGIVETDEAKRQEIYETIQKTLIDDMALYPYVHPKSILVANKRVGGMDDANALSSGFVEDYSKLYIVR